jgi:hypothetical protein
MARHFNSGFGIAVFCGVQFEILEELVKRSLVLRIPRIGAGEGLGLDVGCHLWEREFVYSEKVGYEVACFLDTRRIGAAKES